MGGAWQAHAWRSEDHQSDSPVSVFLLDTGVLGLQVHAITLALGAATVGSNNQKVFLHTKSSPWSFDLFFTKKKLVWKRYPLNMF